MNIYLISLVLRYELLREKMNQIFFWNQNAIMYSKLKESTVTKESLDSTKHITSGLLENSKLISMPRKNSLR